MFGRNIYETTSHQTIIQFPTSLNVCSCTTLGNNDQRNITFLYKVVLLLNLN